MAGQVADFGPELSINVLLELEAAVVEAGGESILVSHGGSHVV